MNFITEFAPRFFEGLTYSLLISAAGFLLAIVIGICCGSVRFFRWPVVNSLVGCYVNIFRCTPLLVQIFLIFYALPEIGIRLSPFVTGVVALGLWGGAYSSEDVRAGLEAVAKREILAARSLGMGAAISFTHITLPLGMRYALPSLTTTTLNIFRSSSFMIVVGYSELTYTANRVASDTFNVYGAFGTAALLYLVSSVALGHIGRSIERATYFPGLGQGVR